MASPKSSRIGAGITGEFGSQATVIRKAHDMSRDRTHQAGFAPRNRERVRGHCSMMVAQLIATVALVLSIAVAATAVSIGIARADGIETVVTGGTAHLTKAILLAVGLVGMTGFATFLGRGRTRLKPGK
jgi:hypothetical protein